MHKFLSERAAELARLAATVRSGLEEAEAIIPPLNDQLSELAMLGVAHHQVEGPSVYARPAGLSNDTDDAIVVFQAVLLMPGGIGAATWSGDDKTPLHRVISENPASERRRTRGSETPGTAIRDAVCADSRKTPSQRGAGRSRQRARAARNDRSRYV